MTSVPALPAAVLAGGRSSRLGPNKLVLHLRGTPLVGHAVRAVKEVRWVTNAYLVVSPGSVWDVTGLGADGALVDEFMVGPPGAVLTALEVLDECVVVGGDMPLINPAVLEALIRVCSEACVGCAACVPRVGRFLEPLHAVYGQRLAPILRAALSCGHSSLQELLKLLVSEGVAVAVDVEAIASEAGLGLSHVLRSFTNINTWGDLMAVARGAWGSGV